MPLRGYLNSRSVLAIFADRPRRESRIPASDVCNALASKYKVSKKTIRDIWNRNSWHSLTESFCPHPEPTDNLSDLPRANSDASSTSSISSSSSIAVPQQQPVANFDTVAVSIENNNDLLDDIDELAESRDQDPFCAEWNATMTDIDMTMVAAHEMVTGHETPIATTDYTLWTRFSQEKAPAVRVSDCWFVCETTEPLAQATHAPSARVVCEDLEAREWRAKNAINTALLFASASDLHTAFHHHHRHHQDGAKEGYVG
eukprot:3691264-Rhodomonas_salina.1